MNTKYLEAIQPLIIAYGYRRNSNQTIFLGYGKRITVEGCNEVLNKMLPLCDGIHRLGDILRNLGDEYDINSLIELVKILIRHEIFIDSSDLYWIFHSRSMNPTLYGKVLSESEVAEILRQKNYKTYRSRRPLYIPSFSDIDSGFLEFLRQRKSTSKFFCKDISFANLGGLMRAAYGVTRREKLGPYTILHRTVPSAGALYPLELYLVNLITIKPLQKGLYYFNKESEYLVPLKIGDFSNRLKEMLIEANETIDTASLLLIVTARFSRSCKKYSNRGYRHILLEAGHLAQNVYLYCIDQGLETVELSGFFDESLCDLLEISGSVEAPITVLAIGSK